MENRKGANVKHLDNDAQCFLAGYQLALDGLLHFINRPELIGESYTADKLAEVLDVLRGFDILALWETLKPTGQEPKVDPMTLWKNLFPKGE